MPGRSGADDTGIPFPDPTVACERRRLMSVGKLFDISGRNALVTGGSRGLGLQIAEALGEMGARVAVTARKRSELDDAVAHLAKLGIKAVALESDLSNAAAISPVVARAIDALGP